MPESTELSPDLFPTVMVAVLWMLVGVLALAALVLFVGWLWGLKDRLPSRLRRLEADHATALSQARGSARATEDLLKASRKALEEANAILQAHATRAAALRAALEESQTVGQRIEDKALGAVARASAESAAMAAEARRLDKAVVAANEDAQRKQDLLRQLKVAYDDLEIRHSGTLADLAKLRDCQHLEQATVYTRETDPATGSRPYRSPGSMCKRCHYVLTDSEPTAAPIAGLAVADG